MSEKAKRNQREICWKGGKEREKRGEREKKREKKRERKERMEEENERRLFHSFVVFDLVLVNEKKTIMFFLFSFFFFSLFFFSFSFPLSSLSLFFSFLLSFFSRIKYQFPNGEKEKQEMEKIGTFCYPDIDDLSSSSFDLDVERRPTDFFSFVLTSDLGF